MTENLSLKLSEEIRDMMRTDIAGLLIKYYPTEIVRNYRMDKTKRDRVYNDETTLLTMIISSTQEDKSLQNSVNIYSEIHRKNIENIKEKEQEYKEKQKKMQKEGVRIQIAKSKKYEVSTNTSAYTQARERLDMGLVEAVFEESGNFEEIKINNKWKGMTVNITDGTYSQMQDTDKLKEIYGVRTGASEEQIYPQALLQVVIEQGSGAVKHIEIGNRYVSELELINKIIPKLKSGTLLLADDLYNSYAIFSLMKAQGVEIIVPGKRERKYKVIEKITEGDEIVEIKKTKVPKWLSKDFKLPSKLIMRRIEFEDPNNAEKKCVIFTSLIDKTIKATEITVKYFSRWDIEINIREIKTIMDINIIRAKRPDIVIKEIYTALIAYNLIRKIIAKTTEYSDFSPKADIIQKYYQAGKTIFMDKRGKLYKRWSPGRYAATGGINI